MNIFKNQISVYLPKKNMQKKWKSSGIFPEISQLPAGLIETAIKEASDYNVSMSPFEPADSEICDLLTSTTAWQSGGILQLTTILDKNEWKRVASRYKEHKTKKVRDRRFE